MAGWLLLLPRKRPPTPVWRASPVVFCETVLETFTTSDVRTKTFIFLKEFCLDLLRPFCISFLFSDCNPLQSQQYLSCSLVCVSLCLYGCPCVRLRVEGWEKGGKGAGKKRESERCVWISLTQCTSRAAVPTSCDVWRRARRAVNIKFRRSWAKEGRQSLENLSRCLARDRRPWSESRSGHTQTHTASFSTVATTQFSSHSMKSLSLQFLLSCQVFLGHRISFFAPLVHA